MAITLDDAITQVRYILNETSPTFWTDAELTDYIQEGTRQFASKTLMVEDTQTISPLIANQLSYSSADEEWIANMIEPYAAIYNDASNGYKGLIKMHPRQIGNLATFTSGAPKYYCLHDRSIYIWPLTTSTLVSAGATVKFLFAKATEDITDITDEYQHLPLLWAAARAKQKDQKFAEANSLLAQFYNEINFERNDKHAREVDSLEAFKIPKSGGEVGARRNQ